MPRPCKIARGTQTWPDGQVPSAAHCGNSRVAWLHISDRSPPNFYAGPLKFPIPGRELSGLERPSSTGSCRVDGGNGQGELSKDGGGEAHDVSESETEPAHVDITMSRAWRWDEGWYSLCC